MKLLVKRRPIRFVPQAHHNSLMAHWVDDRERPLCGARLRLDHWTEVPSDQVAEYEICRNCRRAFTKQIKS